MTLFSQFLLMLETIEDVFWTYGGVPALIGLGLYFSIKSGWFQIMQMPNIFKIFYNYAVKPEKTDRGVPPLHAFFAAVGGCVGIGNVISVCTAVQIGGPGAVFWMWIAGLLGMLVKYAEIFLSVDNRIHSNDNSYSGGPIVYLRKAASGKWGIALATVFGLLLCVYGVEIYMFRVIAYSASAGWGISKHIAVFGLLAAIFGAGQGGVRLVGKISSVIIPIFLALFSIMSFVVFIVYADQIPAAFASIFTHAFTSHAAIGGFAGSTMALALSHGVRRACYTGDIGIGYAGTIHAETSESQPEKQASLGVVSIILDTFIICTLSVLLILVTGVWHEGIHEGMVVAAALNKVFPYVQVVWPMFVFLLGYSSLIAFFSVGKKAAHYLGGNTGVRWYYIYAFFMFLAFAYIGQEMHAMTIMSIAGTLLLVINLFGMFRLLDSINFKLRGFTK